MFPLVFLLRFLPDNMYLIFLFLRYVYCKFVFLLLTYFTFFSAITIITNTDPIEIAVFFNITMTITTTIFTLRHFFLLGNPSANHLTNLVHGQVMVSIIFLIILSLLNVIEEVITIFCFPLTTIFNIPFTGLNFPV